MTTENEPIVISGISGRFPESDNAQEFKQNLFEGIDMVTEKNPRWPPGMFSTPTRYGKIKDLDLFDATFLGISPKQAHVMDPGLRLLLEVTHEAITDAGFSPREIRGSNVGVFVGVCHSESEFHWNQRIRPESVYIPTGNGRSMFSNQISFIFDLKGPSISIDTACSSSMFALHEAITAIQTGQCDSAIVGASNMILHPHNSVSLQRLNILNSDGKCKTFDNETDGYVRAETVAIIYLQRASVARRCYSTILGSKVNADGYKEHGISYPSQQAKLNLCKEFYHIYNIDPLQINYIEFHGTGTATGDPQEVNPVGGFFCQNREKPLLIGSVKSNMGHSEAGAGLCAIIKAILVFECGKIPKNLHFNTPNQKIPLLLDGRLEVVTKNTLFEGNLIAVNSNGLGGTNAHLVLEKNLKTKILPIESSFSSTLPNIVCVSGRTKEAVDKLFNLAEEHKNDKELITLLNFSFNKFEPRHTYRGYLILNSENNKKVSEVLPQKRPIWFIITGMGSQWPGMGSALIKLEVFQNSIKRSSALLEKYGINLQKCLLDNDLEKMENPVHMFVSIASFQIALINLLKHIGIEPDGFIGHSFGEICCAYADGLLTAEEALLCAYYRGLSGLESSLPSGNMAVVGLSAEEVRKVCPPTIFVACDNSENNVTITGPPKDIDKFLEELRPRNIFIRKIESFNTAFHSKYVECAASKLKNYLKTLIPTSKLRSSKWISTSVPESEWETSKSNLSAEYYVNNYVSPVLFRQALKHVPENAITIEIGATSLFKPILLKSIGPNSVNISLVKKQHSNNLEFFLSALGDIYNAGSEPRIDFLYPKIEFPVSRGTPMISPYVKWDHTSKWTVPNYEDFSAHIDTVVEINLSTNTDSYLTGHALDAKIIFPAAGYVKMAWEAYAVIAAKSYTDIPVIIENFEVKKATVLHENTKINFFVNICQETGQFKIYESESIVAAGIISTLKNLDSNINPQFKNSKSKTDTILLTTSDIYLDFRLRGYDYNGLFQSIVEYDCSSSTGKLKWDHNWVTFLDGMLQFLLIENSDNDLYMMSSIREIIIDPKEHVEFVDKFKENQVVPVSVNHVLQGVACGGIQLTKISTVVAPKRKRNANTPTLEKYLFVPYNNYETLSSNKELCKKNILKVLTQVVLENSSTSNISILELVLNTVSEYMIIEDVKKIFEGEPRVTVTSTIVSPKICETKLDELDAFNHIEVDPNLQDFDEPAHLVIINDVVDLNQTIILKNIKNNIKPGGFVMMIEENASNTNFETLLNCKLIASQKSTDKIFKLYRTVHNSSSNKILVEIKNDSFDWVDELKSKISDSLVENSRVLMYSCNSNFNGLIGLVNTLRLEPGGKNIRSLFIDDKSVLLFNVEDYNDELEKDLVQNVYKNGTWGSYRHLLLDYENENHKVETNNAYVDILIPGDFSTFTWFEASPYVDAYENVDNKLALVSYASLNFRDVMQATGKINVDSKTKKSTLINYLGFEFSGTLKNGKRIMGISQRALSTTVITYPLALWDVPENWTLEEAATIPSAYASVYCALIVKGKLQKRESILIHSGAGAVGTAAITLALHLDCEVFTTVSSETKKQFLLKRFPKLKEANIGNSRNKSFEKLIATNTNGEGVNVILNSLSGDLLQASVHCLSKNGRFLEIGKMDFINNSSLHMKNFLENCSFISVSLDYDFFSKPIESMKIHKLLSDGIASGVVQPLLSSVFEADKVEDAFRLLASGKSIGKVLIKMKDCINSERKPLMAISKSYMNSKNSYIIVGGLGGFGLELANWLIKKGATKIILTSRNGIVSGYQDCRINKWREAKVDVKIFTLDLSMEKNVTELIKTANAMGKIEGIFNLAVVLNDAIFENQSLNTFEETCKPKISITKHLDKITRKMIPDLKYFVVFSSLACGRGNPGQSNYSFANSAIERICENRRECGFHGLAIQWGAIDDVGIIARRSDKNKILEQVLPQRISSCLRLMNQFLKEKEAVVCSMIINNKYINTKNESTDIAHVIANVLGITNPDATTNSISLSQLGMNSLMASEIKLLLEERFGITITLKDIRNLTLNKIKEMFSKKTEVVNLPPNTDIKATS